MSRTQFLPMVVYGTITTNSRATCLSFLFIDPITGLIPMKRDAFTVLFNDTVEGRWGWDKSDIRRAKNESEEVYEIFSKLTLTKGLDRLWATPTNLIVHGDSACFDSISIKICSVMKKVLGKIEFHKVPHDEAAPLFLNFKKTA